ncbi:MAG: peptidyl-prolyl cis-trans isomerase [Polyangiaceae bacterium]|nr:peptidyl-prolyl cis-trans isomerase [Polyangiaceae bacterium]
MTGPEPTPVAPASRLRRLLREPLIHFVVAGALLFGLDRAVRAAKGGDEDRRIVLDRDLRASLRERWTTMQGRAPTDEELDAEVARFRDDEILYREGRERGLDRNDPRVREVVASKMGGVLRAQVVVPEPTDEELRAYYEANRERWSKAELFDFTHVFVAGDDEEARTRADELLARLREGAEPSKMGDTFQGGRRYRRRKLEDLASTFGDSFIEGMAEQPTATWVLRRSRFGFHVVRVEKRSAAEQTDFETARVDVRKAWEDDKKNEGFARSLEELRSRWTIEEQR